MVKKFIWIISVIILFLSCTENVVEIETINETIVPEVKNMISQKEAVDIFKDYLNDLNSNSRSTWSINSAEVIISSVKKVYSSDYSKNLILVRSSGGKIQMDVPFYEITLKNHDNTEGFAVVVGDKRFPEVIAYCPFGSIADTLNNLGLAMFFRETAAIISWELNKQVIGNNMPVAKAIDHWQPERSLFYQVLSETRKLYDYFYYEEGTSQQWPWWFGGDGWWYSGSMLTEAYNASIAYRWHQYPPFNDHVPVMLNGMRAPIGCVPLAIGTVMAYHKYPRRYNWNAITSSETLLPSTLPGSNIPQDAVAKMLYDVGIAASTIWWFDDQGKGHGGNYTDSDMKIGEIKNAFKTFGYSCEITANRNIINVDSVKNNIKRDLPIIIVSNSNYGGHAFVVDGIMIRKKMYYNQGAANYDWISGTNERVDLHYVWQTEMRAYQLHCLWGWTNGMGNGWYYRLIPIDMTIPVDFTGYNKSLYTNIKPI